MRALIAVGGTVLWVAACGSAGKPLMEPDGASSTTAVEHMTTTITEDPGLRGVPRSDAGLLALARQARSDLAASLGVPEEQIAITSAAAVIWNDSSIGCPQPEMSYAQVPAEGARITLAHDGITYTYHQSRGVPFLCAEPADGSYVVSKDDSGELELIPPPGYND